MESDHICKVSFDERFLEKMVAMHGKAEGLTKMGGGNIVVLSILLGPNEMIQFASYVWMKRGMNCYQWPGSFDFYGYPVKAKLSPGMDLELDPRFSTNFIHAGE